MIILIGCFWELELGYTPNVYTSKLDSKPDFSFLFAYSCCFFFSAKHFSCCCLPNTYVYFFTPILKKETLFCSFLGRKKKKTRKKMKILRHLHISFSFFSFLINVSIFYMVVLKEKFFSFKRDLSLLKKFGGLEYKKD